MANRFCPNCGSRKVEPDFRRTNVIGELIANQNKWLCNECGYAGWMPAGEKDDDIDDIEFDKPKKQPKIDTDLGIGEYKVLLYIELPLVILFIIVILLFR